MSKSFGIEDVHHFIDEHYFDNQDVEVGVKIDSLKMSDGIMDFEVKECPNKSFFYTGSVLSSLETNVAIEKEVRNTRAAVQKRQKELELLRSQEAIKNQELIEKKIQQDLFLKEIQKKHEELMCIVRGKTRLYISIRLIVNPDYDILATSTHCCLPFRLPCQVAIEISTLKFNAFCIEEQLSFTKLLEKEWVPGFNHQSL